jgi:hypothetical protein
MLPKYYTFSFVSNLLWKCLCSIMSYLSSLLL